MLKGMTVDEKKKLGLSKATDYTYLTIVSLLTVITYSVEKTFIYPQGPQLSN